MTQIKKKTTFDYQLRSLWHSVMKMYNEKASEYNSTMVTGYTLLSIDPINGTPSTSLGPKMGVEKTSISRTIKALEERKLISKYANPKDGRGIIIKLTKEGIEMREESKKIVKRFNSVVLEEVGQEKMETFYEVLDTINNLIVEKKIYNIKL